MDVDRGLARREARRVAVEVDLHVGRVDLVHGASEQLGHGGLQVRDEAIVLALERELGPALRRSRAALGLEVDLFLAGADARGELRDRLACRAAGERQGALAELERALALALGLEHDRRVEQLLGALLVERLAPREQRVEL